VVSSSVSASSLPVKIEQSTKEFIDCSWKVVNSRGVMIRALVSAVHLTQKDTIRCFFFNVDTDDCFYYMSVGDLLFDIFLG
jgi:hypothetical protein